MWQRWLELVHRQESATVVALFRMAMGACLLLTVGWVWLGGILDAVWVTQGYGGIHRLGGTWLVQQLGGSEPEVVHGLVAANLLVGALLVVGFGGRLTALAAVFLAQGLLFQNPYADAAYDLLLVNGLWLVVLMGGTQTLSVDARLRSGSFITDATIGTWARLLIVFQLAVMYTSTGLQKLSAHWVPWGDLQALWYILMMPSFAYRDWSMLAPLEPLLQLSTLVTWVWEVLGWLFIPAALLAPQGSRAWWWLRAVWIALGLAMHGVLLLTMEVGPFPFTTLAFYVALFHPDELERAATWARTRWAARASSAPAR